MYVCTCTCTAVQDCRCISFPFTCTVHALSVLLSLSLYLLSLSLSSQDTCTLKSKFEVSSGPTSPTPALVHFMCDGSTLSGVAMAIESSAYKISLQKNKCFSGKDIIIVSLGLLFIAVFVTINSKLFVLICIFILQENIWLNQLSKVKPLICELSFYYLWK